MARSRSLGDPAARDPPADPLRGCERTRPGAGTAPTITLPGGHGVCAMGVGGTSSRRAAARERRRSRGSRAPGASPHLEGWLRADVARVLGRPRSAIHGCRSLLGCDVKEITGSPDPKHISTSYVERQNLTMRMSMRRFTRLTNAFSKKVENHAAAIALYFMYYNFGRIHQTLRVTPAMEAGVANHVWSVEEIVGLFG